MTTIYFIRHAESDYTEHNDELRPLTDKGLIDRQLVTAYLMDKDIKIILSSPYKRAVDTLVDFANKVNLPIITVPDFRERKVESEWIDDFDSFARQQWQDFNFKLSDGESLSEVQQRGIASLKKVLENYKNQNIAIGTHGTILSTIINFYDKSFGYNEFNEIKHVMPWIVKFEFDGDKCKEIEKINIFKDLKEK